MFSKKATKFDKIFTVDLTLTANCQIDGEDFLNFCGLLRKQELYQKHGKDASSDLKCIKPQKNLYAIISYTRRFQIYGALAFVSSLLNPRPNFLQRIESS